MVWLNSVSQYGATSSIPARTLSGWMSGPEWVWVYETRTSAGRIPTASPMSAAIRSASAAIRVPVSYSTIAQLTSSSRTRSTVT